MPLPNFDDMATKEFIEDYVRELYHRFEERISAYSHNERELTEIQVRRILTLTIEGEHIPEVAKNTVDKAIDVMSQNPDISLEDFLDQVVPKDVRLYLRAKTI